MAQNYSLMARKNLLKPDEAPKYYAVVGGTERCV